MISPLATRRQADEFARLVEHPSADGAPAQWVPLTDLVGALRSAPDTTPRPEFVGRLREQLISEAEEVLVPAGRRHDAATSQPLAPAARAGRRRDRAVLAAAVGCVLAGTTGSVAVAAQSALPGEPLYGVKQGVESLQRAASLSEAAQGKALLGNASDRLTEVGELSDRDTAPADAVIPPTLEEFADQAQHGAQLLLTDYEVHGTEGSVVAVRTFVAESLRTLEMLYAMVPADAQPAVQQAAETVAGIEDAAVETCPGCAGPPAAQLPELLTSSTAGKVPVTAPAPQLQERSPRSGSDRDGSATGDEPATSSGGDSNRDRSGTPEVTVPDPEQLKNLPGSVTKPPSRPPRERTSPGSGAGSGAGERAADQSRETVSLLTNSLLGGEDGSSGPVGKIAERGGQTVDDLTSSLLGVTRDTTDTVGTVTDGVTDGLDSLGGRDSAETPDDQDIPGR